MKALTLIQLCAREYADIAYERIKKAPTAENHANWLDWLNDAQRAVVLVRPDAFSLTTNLTLVVGPKQSLPAGYTRIIAVTRNMGADGATSGRTVNLVDGADLSAVNENWYSATPKSPVRDLVYNDKKDPLTFWVSPPAVAGWKIEATLAKNPTDVADADTGDIALPDTYAAALQTWMLFRAYAKATQAVGHLQRAQTYFTAFFNLLGVKLRGDMWTAALGPAQLPAAAA